MAFLTLAFAFAAAAAGTQIFAGSTDLAEELLRADQAYGRLGAETPPASLVERFANEDLVYVERGILRGRQAVIAHLQSDTAVAASRWSWQPVFAGVAHDGRHGYTYGYTRMSGKDGVELPGKYLAYWQRAEDGTWRAIVFKRARSPGEPSASHMRALLEPATGAAATASPADSAVAATAAAEVWLVDEQFATAAQADVTGAFETYAAADAVTFGATPDFVHGREAVVLNFSRFPAGTLTWRPAVVRAARSGDLAVSVGPVSITNPENGDVVEGSYVTIWRRQPNGTWLFVADG